MLEGIKLLIDLVMLPFNAISGLMDIIGFGLAFFAEVFAYAPSFLAPVMTLTLGIAIIMWIINIF